MGISKFSLNQTLRYFFILVVVHGACFADSSAKQERKTFVVTGASGELGSAAARALAANHDLILTGRNLSKLETLQQELQTLHPGTYEIYPLDFVSSASRASFDNYLEQTDSQIAGVVLITPRPQFYGKNLIQEERVWLEVLQSTFTGPVETLKVLFPYLTKPSKIVVIAGTTAVQLQPQYGPSCVIRRMWTTYTKALAYQLGPQQISVNALSPGVVLTNFHQERIQDNASKNGVSYEEQMEKEVANIPLQRHAKPEEVAQAIQFLLSEQSGFVNGINLVIDGGITLSY